MKSVPFPALGGGLSQRLAADFLRVPMAASQRALAITGALCPRTLMTKQSVIVLR